MRLSIGLVGVAAVLSGLPANAAAQRGRAEVNEGNRLYEEGRFGEAHEKYLEALRDAPGSPLALFNDGNALYQSEEYERALDAYRQAAMRPSPGRPGTTSEMRCIAANSWRKAWRPSSRLSATTLEMSTTSTISSEFWSSSKSRKRNSNNRMSKMRATSSRTSRTPKRMSRTSSHRNRLRTRSPKTSSSSPKRHQAR